MGTGDLVLFYRCGTSWSTDLMFRVVRAFSSAAASASARPVRKPRKSVAPPAPEKEGILHSQAYQWFVTIGLATAVPGYIIYSWLTLTGATEAERATERELQRLQFEGHTSRTLQKASLSASGALADAS